MSEAVQAGPHILGGPGSDVVSRYASQIQTAKCIVDFASGVCPGLKRLNPQIQIIARTLTVDGGMWDCPQPWEYANGDPSTWYARIKSHLPAGYDAYEGQNECGPPPQGYAVWAQWSIKLAQLINRDYNAVYLAFSFAPGNPDIAHWGELLPYLEWVAANPLPDGRYNGVAVHSAMYMSGAVPPSATWINNVWLAGREVEIARYLATKGFDLRAWPGQWVLSETGLHDGYAGDWGLTWTCDQLRDAYQTSARVWADQGVVTGFNDWNVGKMGKWSDVSGCWAQMVQ